jgi:hypothetical protein
LIPKEKSVKPEKKKERGKELGKCVDKYKEALT